MFVKTLEHPVCVCKGGFLPHIPVYQKWFHKRRRPFFGQRACTNRKKRREEIISSPIPYVIWVNIQLRNLTEIGHRPYLFHSGKWAVFCIVADSLWLFFNSSCSPCSPRCARGCGCMCLFMLWAAQRTHWPKTWFNRFVIDAWLLT